MDRKKYTFRVEKKKDDLDLLVEGDPPDDVDDDEDSEDEIEPYFNNAREFNDWLMVAIEERFAEEGIDGSVGTYRDHGIMTQNLGLVVEVGSMKFQITLAGSYDADR